jgi:23S rRNA (uracil1939-C5)-methyltransferase
MKPKKGQEIEIKIDSLVYGGSGIGTFEGFKVFVEGACIGDSVLARVFKVKSSFAEAKLLKVLKESPLRIAPRCAHFGVCGGCKWQFLRYSEQVKIKEEQVRNAITRIGGLNGNLVLPIIPCAEEFFYRNKLEFSFALGSNGQINLGFFPLGYHYEVTNLKECFLESVEAVEIVSAVREFANASGVSSFDAHNGEGLLKELTVRESKSTGERMIILTINGAAKRGFSEKIKKDFVGLFNEKWNVKSIFLQTVTQAKGNRTRLEYERIFGAESITESLKLASGKILNFDILPDAFFQTNTRQAEVLYSKVVEMAGLSGKETVFDLYSGTGTIGLFCAEKAEKVIGIEINEDAVLSAKKNAMENHIGNAKFHLGAVEDILEEVADKPDVLIFDPPRAGLTEKIVETAAGFGAEKIVYVSCNPTTLARDLKFFAASGYETLAVQPVDMFPQTHHVECVGVMERSVRKV